jgi:3'-phosphoadenosine 5'-phosphosulfate sulfotransferase (PAPS reductase)/FAD synthetase
LGGQVYISFSGGKDSTVLLDIVRGLYPDVKAAYVDTGLEYPENRYIINSYENIEILKPNITFKEVIKKWGYPVISKEIAHKISFLQNPTENNKKSRKLFLTGINSKGDKCNAFKLPEKWKFLIDAPFKISAECCSHLKKNPIKKYVRKTGRVPITGMMAIESNARTRTYIRNGCSIFNDNNSICNPLAVWTEQDILQYIYEKNLKISKWIICLNHCLCSC